MRTTTLLVAAGLLAVAAGAYAAQERLLFDNPGYDVFVPEDFYCDQPVRVTVRGGNPDLFEANSPALQRIVDTAQAVLAFECPTVRGVELEGRLAGLPEPVYFGVAGPESNWELTAKQSIQSKEYEGYQQSAGEEDHESSEPAGEFTVANLSVGMSVEKARASVARAFGVEPEYEAESGILTMQSGGCPEDYDWAALSPTPEPGWKCLQAWFTDQRLARLYLLDLVQVIDSQDPQRVERHLIDRFGEPASTGTRQRDRAWWQEEQTVYTIGWGDVVDNGEATGNGQPTEIHNLQAQILPIGDATIVTVTLYEPELRPRMESEPDAGVPDLTL